MQHNTAGLKLGTGFFELDLSEVEKPSTAAKTTFEERQIEKPQEFKTNDITSDFKFDLKQFTPAPAPEKIENTGRRSVKTDKEGDKVATLILNADLLIKNDEKELAQHLLRQSLYVNSYHPQALGKLATCLRSSKDLNLRAKVLETLKQTDYGFENLVELGNCYYQQGKDAEATSVYHEALSTLTDETPVLFEVYKNLGNIALREGDFDSAEENYNKAHTQNSRSDILEVNQGTLAIQRADWESAVTHFRAALQINHRNDRAWVGLAMVHNSMGDFVLARGNVGKAVDLNPENRTAVQLAATWAIRDQDLSTAVDTLQNYVSLVDSDEEMSLLLVHLFCQRNQWFEAQLEVERLLLWDPKNQRVQKVEEEIRRMRGT